MCGGVFVWCVCSGVHNVHLCVCVCVCVEERGKRRTVNEVYVYM